MATTREEWLMDAVEFFRPWFEKHDTKVPEKVRISVGYAKRQSKNAIGVCYHSVVAEDKVNQIFISPEIKEPVKVLGVVLHELIHASDDGASGHKGEFRRLALAMGLEGKMTATVPGEDLALELDSLAVQLGEYPHGVLTPSQGGPGGGAIGKQTTRMLKLSASCCGYVARTTKKWLQVGVPSCPCGNPMELEMK